MGKVALVHGALHGPWCWDGVVTGLRDRGVETVAPELPFTGFRDDVATARTAIEVAGPGVVVCGHSYGGMVISAAASGLSGVTRLVYLAAFQTDIGENLASLTERHPSPGTLAPEVVDGTITFDPVALHDFFYGDSDASVVATIAPMLRAMTFDAWTFEEEPAWKHIPSTYILCTRDRAVAPALQREMATRADVVVEWENDHSPFLTRPDDIAEILSSYVAHAP